MRQNQVIPDDLTAHFSSTQRSKQTSKRSMQKALGHGTRSGITVQVEEMNCGSQDALCLQPVVLACPED